MCGRQVACAGGGVQGDADILQGHAASSFDLPPIPTSPSACRTSDNGDTA